jgi:hypothetical protein
MSKVELKVECSSCSGTGIYRGFAEPPGVGVICLHCDGSGADTILYTPFTSRKTRTDIKTVQRSRGSLLDIGVGPAGNAISYNEFLQGRKP